MKSDRYCNEQNSWCLLITSLDPSSPPKSHDGAEAMSYCRSNMSSADSKYAQYHLLLFASIPNETCVLTGED